MNPHIEAPVNGDQLRQHFDGNGRGVTIVAALILGLVLLYVGSYFAAARAMGTGRITWDTYERLTDTIYWPLERYVSSDLPGSDAFKDAVERFALGPR